MNNRYLFLALSLLISLSFGCRREAGVPGRLAEIREQMAKDPAFPYANSLRAKLLARKLQGIPYDMPLSDKVLYVRELLFSGQNERCIVETERIVQAMYPDRKVNFVNRPYFEVLALAYLRLGEQENCIDRHNTESCIVPIAGNGIHSRRSGSEQAVDLYLRLLEDNPKDLQSRWLLNIAYMTLGAYPESAPKEWLIPPDAFASEYPMPRFPDLAFELGLDVRGHAGGCAMDDFNGDGLLDVFTTSYLLEEPAHLFINRGPGRPFQDNILEEFAGGLNCTHADYDNDGDLDLFVTRGAWLGPMGRIPNSLLRNRGDGTFDDVTEEAGLLSFAPSQVSAWADINLDGWLDLFVGNESSHGERFPCELYLNRGDGSFENIAAAAGLDLSAVVKGASWGDVNDDGFPDLYVSVMNEPNRLFLNTGSTQPSFRSIGTPAGVAEPVLSFPVWFFDYDNDGREDIFVSGYEPGEEAQVAANTAAAYLGLPHREIYPRLYRNISQAGQEPKFEDVTEAAGLKRPLYTMGCNFGDLDQDGWLDFYLATGEFTLGSVTPNRAFRNAEGRLFQDVTTAAGLGQIQKGHAVAFGDIDGDGDEDLYTVTGGALEGDIYYASLFENPGSANHSITLRLRGSRSNRSAIGARVRLVVSLPNGRQRSIYRTVNTGGSFGASSLQLEIGLGGASSVDTVEVRWPNRERTMERWVKLKAGERYELVEGEG